MADDVINVTAANTLNDNVLAVMSETSSVNETAVWIGRAVHNLWQAPAFSTLVSRSGSTDCREK